MRSMKLERIVITPGEPAGIGPDLILNLVSQRLAVQPIIVADPELLQQRSKQLGIEVDIQIIHSFEDASSPNTRQLLVYPVSLAKPSHSGKLSTDNVPYVIKCLDIAIQSCLDKQCKALVTGPVHKGIINDAGIPFTGQTEYLAQQSNVAKTVMMLANPKFRVALATTHLALREVADAINEKNLTDNLTILQRELIERFKIATPKILVCGLNPHAGEGGHLGREEIDIIIPCLEKLRQQGFNLQGPLPADTLFTEKYLKDADAVFAMYHDQGLPVLKYAGFGEAVNITLGLPFIRTSVDHGTACDLAGTGKANPSSLYAAIQSAETLS